MEKKKSQAILSLTVIERKELEGAINIPGKVQVLDEAHTYSFGNRKLNLYEDSSGRPIPSEWKSGVTITGHRITGSQENGGCIIYHCVTNDGKKTKL